MGSAIESLCITDTEGLCVSLSVVSFVRKNPHNESREESGGKRWEENPNNAGASLLATSSDLHIQLKPLQLFSGFKGEAFLCH